MSSLPSSSTEIRERNVHLVLDVLSGAAMGSRAEIADQTGLSKPTVSAVLRALESVGLVRESGRTTGRRGPGAALYRIVPDAALVLGIDVGAKFVRADLSDLNGETVEHKTVRLASATIESVLASIQGIATDLGDRYQRVELAVLGSPGIIDPTTGLVRAAPHLVGWDGIRIEQVVGRTLQVPVLVENDVNLAAIGEAKSGSGADAASFGYLSIGSGLGAGIVLRGQIHRGARGAAGEIGFLPVGEDPFAESSPGGPMESRLSSQALIDLAEHHAPSTPTTLSAPFDLEMIFHAAYAGDPLGRLVVDHAARMTAVCIAGLTSVVDVELWLLGGGIGQSSELLLADIRQATAALIPVPPRIERAKLADRAVTSGAVALGLDVARARIVKRITRRDAS